MLVCLLWFRIGGWSCSNFLAVGSCQIAVCLRGSMCGIGMMTGTAESKRVIVHHSLQRADWNHHCVRYIQHGDISPCVRMHLYLRKHLLIHLDTFVCTLLQTHGHKRRCNVQVGIVIPGVPA